MNGEGDVQEKMDSFDGSDFAGLNFETGFESILEQGPSSSSSVGVSSDGQQNSNINNQYNCSGQCPRCDKYKSDLERLDREHQVNFQFLKKKIISTDLLIRRCKAKTDESETQSKTIADLNQRLEQADRDSAILSEQLKSTVASMKPLKDENERLEHMLKSKSAEVSDLQVRMAAEEAYKRQRQALDGEIRKWESQSTEFNRKLQYLERKKQGLLVRTEKLTREKAAITSEKNIIAKRMLLFGKALHQAQEIVNAQWKKLQLNGLTDGQLKPYVLPARYKSFIAKIQAGECADISDGQEVEKSEADKPLLNLDFDIEEMSDDDDDEGATLEAGEKEEAKESRKKGKGLNKKVVKEDEKKEEEESDGNLSDVSILSHIDEDWVGKKDEGKVKSSRIESFPKPGDSSGIRVEGDNEKNNQSKSPSKTKRIFVKKRSREMISNEMENLDKKFDCGADPKKSTGGALLTDGSEKDEIGKFSKFKELDSEGIKINKSVVSNEDLSSLSSDSSDSEMEDDSGKKERDKKQNLFPNLTKAPQRNVASKIPSLNSEKDVKSEQDSKKWNDGKSSESSKKNRHFGELTNMTYAKSSTMKKVKMRNRGKDGDRVVGAMKDSDSLSSLSETSEEESQDVERKAKTSVRRKHVALLLKETFECEDEKKTSLISGKDSLLSSEGDEDDDEPIISMPFTNLSEDDEVKNRKGGHSSKDRGVPVKEKGKESFSKKELQALLLSSPMFQVLSPLPPSPCPGALSRDSDDDVASLGNDIEDVNITVSDNGNDDTVIENDGHDDTVVEHDGRIDIVVENESLDSNVEKDGKDNTVNIVVGEKDVCHDTVGGMDGNGDSVDDNVDNTVVEKKSNEETVVEKADYHDTVGENDGNDDVIVEKDGNNATVDTVTIEKGDNDDIVNAVVEKDDNDDTVVVVEKDGNDATVDTVTVVKDDNDDIVNAVVEKDDNDDTVDTFVVKKDDRDDAVNTVVEKDDIDDTVNTVVVEQHGNDDSVAENDCAIGSAEDKVKENESSITIDCNRKIEDVGKGSQLTYEEDNLNKENADFQPSVYSRTEKGILNDDLSLSSNGSESESESKSTKLCEQPSALSHASKVLSDNENGFDGSKRQKGSHDKIKKARKVTRVKLKSRKVTPKSNFGSDLSSLSSASSSSEDESCANIKTKKKDKQVTSSRLEGLISGDGQKFVEPVSETSEKTVSQETPLDGSLNVMCGDRSEVMPSGNGQTKGQKYLEPCTVAQNVCSDLSSLSYSSSETVTGKDSENKKKEDVRTVEQINEKTNVLNRNSIDSDNVRDSRVPSSDSFGTGKANGDDSSADVIDDTKKHVDKINNRDHSPAPKREVVKAGKKVVKRKNVSKEFVDLSLSSSSEGEDIDCVKKSKVVEDNNEMIVQNSIDKSDDAKGNSEGFAELSPKCVTRSLSRASSSSEHGMIKLSSASNRHRKLSGNSDVNWSVHENNKSISPMKCRTKERAVERPVTLLVENQKEVKEVVEKEKISTISNTEKNALKKTQMECAAQQLAKMIAKAKAGNARKGIANKISRVGQEIPKSVTTLRRLETRTSAKTSASIMSKCVSQEGTNDALKDLKIDGCDSNGERCFDDSKTGMFSAKQNVSDTSKMSTGESQAIRLESRPQTRILTRKSSQLLSEVQVTSEVKEGKKKVACQAQTAGDSSGKKVESRINESDDSEKDRKEILQSDVCERNDVDVVSSGKETISTRRKTRSQSLRSSLSLDSSKSMEQKSGDEDHLLQKTGNDKEELAQVSGSEIRLTCDKLLTISNDLNQSSTSEDGTKMSSDKEAKTWSVRRKTRNQSLNISESSGLVDTAGVEQKMGDDTDPDRGIMTRKNSIRNSLNDSQGFTVAIPSVSDPENSSVVASDIQKQHQNRAASKKLSLNVNELCQSSVGKKVKLNGDSGILNVSSKAEGECDNNVSTVEVHLDKGSGMISDGNSVILEAHEDFEKSKSVNTCDGSEKISVQSTVNHENRKGVTPEEGEREKDVNVSAKTSDLDTNNENRPETKSITKRSWQTLATSENSAFTRVVPALNQPSTISSFSTSNPTSISLSSSSSQQPTSQLPSNRPSNDGSHPCKGKINSENKNIAQVKYVPPLYKTFIPAEEPLEPNVGQDNNASETTSPPHPNTTFTPSQPLQVIIPPDSISSPFSGSSPSLSVPSCSSSLPARATPTSPNAPNQHKQSTPSERPFSEILRDMINFFKFSPLLSPISSPSSSPAIPTKNITTLLLPSSLSSPVAAAAALSIHGENSEDQIQQRSNRVSTRQHHQQSSSDSQMMMQAKKLLSAKRKATAMGKTNNVDSPDVIKRSKRISQRASQNVSDKIGVEGNQSCGRGKSLQVTTISFSGFSSIQDAVDYSLRHFLSQDLNQPPPSVQSTVDDISAREKDGNLPEIWLCLVNRTMLYMRRFGPQKSSSLERLCQWDGQSSDDLTRLESLEQSVLDLMLAFMDRHQGAVDRSVLMGSIWSAVFDRSLMSTGVRLCLCRLFCALCKKLDDLEQARVLLYNIAWCGYLHFSSCLLSMAGVWPIIIPPAPLSSPLCLVFRLVMYLEMDDDPIVVGQIMAVLDVLSVWRLKGQHAPTPAHLLKSLLDSMIELSARSFDEVFEYIRAVELLCMVQGSGWTQEHFIQKALIGAFQRWNMASSLSTFAIPMMAYLKITKAVLAVHSLSETTVKILGGQVFGKVVNTKLDSLPLTICFGEILMELCPLDSKNGLEFLRMWEATNQDCLSPSILAQLTETRRFFMAANSDNQKTKERTNAGKNGAKNANSKNVKNQRNKRGKR